METDIEWEQMLVGNRYWVRTDIVRALVFGGYLYGIIINNHFTILNEQSMLGATAIVLACL